MESHPANMKIFLASVVSTDQAEPWWPGILPSTLARNGSTIFLKSSAVTPSFSNKIPCIDNMSTIEFEKREEITYDVGHGCLYDLPREFLEWQVHLLIIYGDARKCLREATIFGGRPDSVLGFDTLVVVYRCCVRRIAEEPIIKRDVRSIQKS
jgi:hypothetical protein